MITPLVVKYTQAMLCYILGFELWDWRNKISDILDLKVVRMLQRHWILDQVGMGPQSLLL